MERITELLSAIKPYVLGWIGTLTGGPGPFAPSPHDLNSAHHSGSIADSQAPQFLLSNGGRTLTGNLTVSAGITIDGVDISAFNGESFVTLGNTAGLPNERALTQGDGIGITDGGAGSGVTVAVNSSVARNTWAVNAGNGLTGGGTLASGGITLNVGAGAGLTVNADDVALTTPGGLSATSANSATGNHTHAIDSTIARSAITITGTGALGGGGDLTANRTITMNTPGTLTVTSSNSVAANHTHAITSSSNPGAAASLLASDASGALQLVNLTLSSILTTPRVTAAANLTIDPAGDVTFDPTGNDILPNVNYDLNLGALSKKYLTLHAAELWVETLVAQNTLATIGGRILVGPTNLLTVDLAAGSGSQGSVAYRSVATASTGATPATSLICNKPASTVGGDLLIAQVVVNANAPTIVPPDGWGLVRADAGTGGALVYSAVYRKFVQNGEAASYQFGFNGVSYNANIAITAISGADINTPIDAHNGQSNASSSSCVAPSVTTTAANDLLLFFGATVGSFTFGTVSSMTERYDQRTTNGTNDDAQAGDTQALGAAGATGTRTSTMSGSGVNIGQLVAVRPQGPVDTLTLKYGSFNAGDMVYCEANGAIEFLQLTAGPSGAGPYTYSATRNVDGSGANNWYAGDAVFNTGQAGSGFIDLYSVSGVKSAAQSGPTIAGNVRNSATYNDWTEHWAIGNLNGLYGYGVTTYGVAVGKYSGSTSWLAADATNGIRVMRGSTQLAQWDTNGNILIGQTGASQDNVYISSGAIQIRNNTTAIIDMTAAGVLTIGQVGASQNNVQISSGAIAIRNNTTERIGMTAAGVLTIKDSGGAAVFTFNSSAGAEFTKSLTLGASGGIYQGTGSFASPTTGLKIWNDSGVGRIGGYNGGTVQWYGATDGKLYAGAGAVTIDNDGITVAHGTSGSYEVPKTYKIGSIGKLYAWNYGSANTLFLRSVGDSNETVTWIAADAPSGYNGKVTLFVGSGIYSASLNLQRNGAANGTLNWNGDATLTMGLNVGSATGAGTGEVRSSGSVYINDTSNANMTTGLTINQGGADNDIVSLKSTDVSHSFTTDVEADTYGRLLKNHATNGGLIIDGFGAGVTGVRVGGATHTGDTTKSSSAGARVMIDAWGISGNTRGGIGANENIAAFRNGTTTRFILDGDGDSHQDVGTAWTNFDAHNDVALLTALSVHVSSESDAIREAFNEFLTYNRQRLTNLKLVTFNEDGHHFVNMSRLTMLLVGAVRQLDQRLERFERTIGT